MDAYEKIRSQIQWKTPDYSETQRPVEACKKLVKTNEAVVDFLKNVLDN